MKEEKSMSVIFIFLQVTIKLVGLTYTILHRKKLFKLFWI